MCHYVSSIGTPYGQSSYLQINIFLISPDMERCLFVLFPGIFLLFSLNAQQHSLSGRITSTGRITDNRIIFTGIISHKSVAHMLPEDYIPSMCKSFFILYAMYRPIMCFLLCCLLQISLQAQLISLKGRIVDAGGKPIAYATIYANGTTQGCISGVDGNFELTGITLPTEVVCSHISYELRIQKVKKTTESKQLVFRLQKKRIQLEEASVSELNMRNHYLELFERWFLGEDYKVLDAEILNDSVLYFIPEGPETFRAVASAPLEISVPKTAYVIRCDLVRFKLTANPEAIHNGELHHHSSILGHYFFSDIPLKSRRDKRKVARERTTVYYNSRQHFYRSLYLKMLPENGYQIKENCWNYLSVQDSLDGAADFNYHYQEDAWGEEILCLYDFMCLDFKIYFHCIRGKYPLDLTQYISNEYHTIESHLKVRGDTVCIYPSGRVPDNSMLFSGSMGNKGVAFLLPYDYIPSMQ